MLKPLIINRSCYYYGGPGGECLRMFIEALDKETFKPIVYASDRTPLVTPIPEYAKLTHEYRWVRYAAAAVRRVLSDLTYLPGYEWQSWAKKATRQIIRDIKHGNIEANYIHSVSFPCACHTAALKVKKEVGLPWIMQFYDPWAENPYRNFKTRFFKEIDWKQERACVEACDLIIHDNDTIAEKWRERYGKEIAKKIVVLPLTIPMPNVVITENTHKSGDLLTISHIGNFMRNRTSHPFIRALAALISRHPEFRKKLRVNYIGAVTRSEKELIMMNGLGDIFNLAGSVSAEDCIPYYKMSDLFLAVDGVNKDNLFFPSKILKYLYFRRPILGITPKGSVLDRELLHSGHFSIANDDIEGIVAYLEKAIIDYESLLNFNYGYWQRFEPQNVASKYEDIVKELLNRSYRYGRGSYS